MPRYSNEVFVKRPKSGFIIKNSYNKLKQLFPKTSIGSSTLSFIGPALWNKIPDTTKRTTSFNAFKHKLKKYCLNEIGKCSF